MFFRLRLLFSTILTVFMLLGLSNSVDAQVRVTVGGMTYDITANVGSFATVQAGLDLTDTNNAPWYTGDFIDRVDAIAFRDAWLAVNDTSAIPAGSELAFAYLEAATLVRFASVSNIAGTLSANGDTNSSISSDVSFASRTLYYASATLITVPEINGSALAQMLLVLSVGYLMLMGRRWVRQA